MLLSSLYTHYSMLIETHMEQIIVCEECSNQMEYYQSHKERLNDGQMHILDEYLCRPCRTFVTFTTGMTAKK